MASTKEQLVIAATKHFFVAAAEQIEDAVANESDPRKRITTYLGGVASAMRRSSRAFYDAGNVGQQCHCCARGGARVIRGEVRWSLRRAVCR
ncbi:hypothetical protein AZG88_01995 [Rhodococcus sp. LB1]|nr:hypothetical protein AZG88_01995 [Rhodococcus sp. LB1]